MMPLLHGLVTTGGRQELSLIQNYDVVAGILELFQDLTLLSSGKREMCGPESPWGSINFIRTSPQGVFLLRYDGPRKLTEIPS